MAKWLTGRPLLYNAVNLMTTSSPVTASSARLAGTRSSRVVSDWFIPNFPNHITAVSPELRDWFVETGVPAAKVDMVPAGIEPDLFDNPKPEKFRDQHQINGHPVVMYTGVLNAFQRIDYLLRAFAIALREKPDALLFVVSPLVSESHEKEYRQLADELGFARSIIWISPHALQDFRAISRSPM